MRLRLLRILGPIAALALLARGVIELRAGQGGWVLILVAVMMAVALVLRARYFRD
jgi:hypothetical protein